MRTHPAPVSAPTAPRATIGSRPAAATTSTAILAMLLRVGLLGGATAACFAFTRAANPSATAADSNLWMNVAIVAVDLVCLWFLATILRKEGSTLRRLFGTDRPGRDALWGLGLFVPLTIAFFAATFIGNLVAYQGPPPATPARMAVPMVVGVVSLVVMPLTVAIAEEAIYRAYALPRLDAALGRVPAVLISTLLFGAQHVFFAVGAPQMMLARFVATFLVGILFALVWFRIGRIWPLVVAHWLLDVLFLGVPMLMLAMGR